MASAFFYGTLMHPEILKRVIGHDGGHLRISPALLPDYTRHKTKGADYPGIVPFSRSRAMFGRDLEPEEISVRGSLVVGLSDEDVRRLDIFEGDEYTRELVCVHPLGRPVGLDDMEAVGAVPPPDELASAVEVNTYVWCRPLSELEPKLWTFEEFVRESAWKWTGAASKDRSDFTAVDAIVRTC